MRKMWGIKKQDSPVKSCFFRCALNPTSVSYLGYLDRERPLYWWLGRVYYYPPSSV